MQPALLNPLALRLDQFARLSTDDYCALDDLVGGSVQTVRPRHDIIREGDRPRAVNLFLEGWACRYKTLEDGRRQITNFFLPGDLCDLNVYILRAMDHSIGALTPLRYLEISRERMDDLIARRPRVAQAFWWDTLVTAAIQREWTVNLGQRDAIERLAHLLCELYYRLRAVRRGHDGRCELPLTQTDLAEATGMTSVHVNRMLQELRARGLIRWKGKAFEVPDLQALCDVALFSPNYLHLDREGASLDAND